VKVASKPWRWLAEGGEGKMNEKILVIDDDSGLLTLVRLGLEREGFTVFTAESGKEGLRRAYEKRPDVIILDITMPEMDGWATCQRLRSMCDTPIIMLSARTDQADLLRGLSLGADDYLTKPCNFEELKARIRTVLRRTRGDSDDAWRATYDDGNLCIDLKDGTVARQGEAIHLTPTESRLLMYLVSQKGRIVPHRELLVSVWGPEYEEEVGYLSVYIRYLRQKIEDDPSNPRYICTRWRMGYYFAGNGLLRPELEEVQDRSAAQ
jgi:DNA-binding response OmpR family regulator